MSASRLRRQLSNEVIMNTKLLIKGKFVTGKGDHREQVLDPATG
jgi:hypothetical protein